MNLLSSKLVAGYIIPLATWLALWPAGSATVPQKVFVVVCFSSSHVSLQNRDRNKLFPVEVGIKLVILENVIFNLKAMSFMSFLSGASVPIGLTHVLEGMSVCLWPTAYCVFHAY